MVRWDEEARRVVAVEPDGIKWKVVLVIGDQRPTVISLLVREACEAYAEWLRVHFIAPLARRAYREALERAAVIAREEGDTPGVGPYEMAERIMVAIRHEIEGMGSADG